ncbi:MAG: glycoside hydrolase [Bacteroidetes bacterium]|nr:glycoside hydrolase [Bacteroidota bacterium]
MKKIISLFSLLLTIGFASCASQNSEDGILKDGVAQRTERITRFANIIDIRNTPKHLYEAQGQFLDCGSWLGYTPTAKNLPMAGFAGPLEIRDNRYFSKSIVTLQDTSNLEAKAVVDTSIYYPGSIYMKGSIGEVKFEQNIYFIDANNAIIKIETNDKSSVVYGDLIGEVDSMYINNGHFVADMEQGSGIVVSLSNGNKIELTEDGYKSSPKENTTTYAVVSFYDTPELLKSLLDNQVKDILSSPEEMIAKSIRRWNGYIQKTLRDSMPPVFDRVAVKSIVTLMSNWKRERGHLYHEGIVPSHAVSYFDGFWAWDSWKHAVAIAPLEPELAKNQIRTMFDFQNERGMVIDCIYIDSSENNPRDTKSSLATWAVQEVFNQTQDTAFVREMFPKLVRYYKWWFQDRDRDGNSICEFGSTDGTLVAAKWESGMDNAVRFDDTKIYKINDKAWAFGQESVDLNGFLNFERQGLLALADLIGEKLELQDNSDRIRDYFYDEESEFFYDRDMESGKLMTKVQGPESWIPLWSKLATKEQAAGVLKSIMDTTKFSTYIPFPTCSFSADGFDAHGYWRGAVWFDQAYFGIHGLRNYGYNKEADMFTEQIFTRPEGLATDGPIYENYEPIHGGIAKAPHFSWSAAHLLMLYKEYNR